MKFEFFGSALREAIRPLWKKHMYHSCQQVKQCNAGKPEDDSDLFTSTIH